MTDTRLFGFAESIPGQLAMPTDICGRRVRINWEKIPPYRFDYAEAICVDPMGTLTFKREEDGFLGIAGSGIWELA